MRFHRIDLSRLAAGAALSMLVLGACSPGGESVAPTAAAVSTAPHAGGCTGAVPATFDAINTYDPCFSAFTNWGRFFPDQTIATTIDGTHRLEVTASTALAGAIASVKVDGKEFIASGGHGAAFGYSLLAHAAGECYNPTENGNRTDDSTPPWNVAPYHGPSTSSLYYLSGDATHFDMASRLAFYVPAGSSSEFNGCLPSYPAGPPYSFGLSPYTLTKTVRVGPQPETPTLENLIVVDATVTVDSGESTPDFDAVLGAYLQSDFNTFFTYDPATGAATYVPFTCYTDAHTACEAAFTRNPVIISTSDAAYAIGIFSPRSLNVDHGEVGAYYMGHASGADPTYPHAYQTLTLTQYASNVSTTSRLSYRTYFAVGNLARVESTISTLAAMGL